MLAVITGGVLHPAVRRRAEPDASSAIGLGADRRRRRRRLHAASRMCAAASTRFLRPRRRRQLPGRPRAGGVRQRRAAGPRPGRGPRQGHAARRPCRLRVRRRRRGIRHDHLPGHPLACSPSSCCAALLRLLAEDDLFVVLAATGLVAGFGLQAFVNMASTLHLIPTKGMTLPFISYGGSSVARGGARHGHAAGADPAPPQRRPAVRGRRRVRPDRDRRRRHRRPFLPGRGAGRRAGAARPPRRADDRCALGRPVHRRCSPGASASCCAGAGIAGARRGARPCGRSARSAAGTCRRGPSWRARRRPPWSASAAIPRVAPVLARAAAAAPSAGAAARAERGARPRQPAAGPLRRRAGAERRRHRAGAGRRGHRA